MLETSNSLQKVQFSFGLMGRGNMEKGAATISLST